MTIPFDADAFFDLDDAAIQAEIEGKSADEIEVVMRHLQNHVDEENRKRGIVAGIYSQKRDAEAAARKLAELSDADLAAELARRQANAQTISIDAVTTDQQVFGNKNE